MIGEKGRGRGKDTCLVHVCFLRSFIATNSSPCITVVREYSTQSQCSPSHSLRICMCMVCACLCMRVAHFNRLARKEGYDQISRSQLPWDRVRAIFRSRSLSYNNNNNHNIAALTNLQPRRQFSNERDGKEKCAPPNRKASIETVSKVSLRVLARRENPLHPHTVCGKRKNLLWHQVMLTSRLAAVMCPWVSGNT